MDSYSYLLKSTGTGVIICGDNTDYLFYCDDCKAFTTHNEKKIDTCMYCKNKYAENSYLRGALRMCGVCHGPTKPMPGTAFNICMDCNQYYGDSENVACMKCNKHVAAAGCFDGRCPVVKMKMPLIVAGPITFKITSAAVREKEPVKMTFEETVFDQFKVFKALQDDILKDYLAEPELAEALEDHYNEFLKNLQDLTR